MTSTEPLAGERLVGGRYRLLRPLGRGGMGVVWAAHDELLQRSVAVKDVRFPPYVDDAECEQLHERTLREARAAARLDHPCAVRVFDVCEDDGHAFIVMELLAGRTLSDVVHQDGPLSPVTAAQIGLCLLDALEAAHRAGIVHRDVKPGNVILRADGRVALTDFGIASTSGDPSITSTGLLLGSPAYMAPERASGRLPGPASDLFSLGATLYTAVEGHPPFDKPNAVATLTAVVIEDHQPCARAGHALGKVVERLLEKSPADRPAPSELRAMLQAVVADPEARLPPALHAGEPPTGPEPSSRARMLALLVLATAVFLASASLSAAAAAH